MNTKKKAFCKKIHIEVTEEQYNLLQQYCLENKLTKAEVLRQLIMTINTKNSPNKNILGE